MNRFFISVFICALNAGCMKTLARKERGLLVNNQLAYARELSFNEKQLFDKVVELATFPKNKSIANCGSQEAIESSLPYPYEYYVEDTSTGQFILKCIICDPPVYAGAIRLKVHRTESSLDAESKRLSERVRARFESVELENELVLKLKKLIYNNWNVAIQPFLLLDNSSNERTHP